ncbi:unnamed protein product [Trichobilharzia regenti]|nr:unnamed protein product [Trichobilharzia regenti]
MWNLLSTTMYHYLRKRIDIVLVELHVLVRKE